MGPSAACGPAARYVAFSPFSMHGICVLVPPPSLVLPPTPFSDPWDPDMEEAAPMSLCCWQWVEGRQSPRPLKVPPVPRFLLEL